MPHGREFENPDYSAVRTGGHLYFTVWAEFKTRYFIELETRPVEIEALLELAKKEAVTLIYASSEGKQSNASALAEFLESKRDPGKSGC